jgi:2'-5' RNA ligase
MKENILDKKLYLLAELDDTSQLEIKEIEKTIIENGFIGKQTKDIPYHITLCSFPIEMEKFLKDLLENSSKKFKKININFSSLGLFGLKVLFMNPNMNNELIEMYNYLKENSFEKDYDLSAHTTLIIDEPENIIKILPKIVEKYKGLNGEIKYISLYEFFPVRFIKRIELL